VQRSNIDTLLFSKCVCRFQVVYEDKMETVEEFGYLVIRYRSHTSCLMRTFLRSKVDIIYIFILFAISCRCTLLCRE